MTLAASSPARTTNLAPVLALACAAAAFALAARFPYQASLVAVILLAGPHNLLELRYFLTHVPARWGPRRGFFLAALGGWAGLGGASIAIHWFGREGAVGPWTAALVAWIALLIRLRYGRSVPWLWAAALAVPWIPLPWDLVLVYAHPLVALAFLDRELRRHDAWRAPYRVFLAALPLCVAALWWAVPTSPLPLADPEALDRVTGLAGAWILPAVAPQRLVAVYVFLQLLHYAAWIVAMPALRFREAPWRVDRLPLSRRFPALAAAILAASAVFVACLWCGFAVSLTTTWDVYFTIAIMHAVAEFPLLVHKCPSR